MLVLLARLCCGLFAGAALYISVVQQPAARAAGDDVAGRLFTPMYRRAAPVQAGLATVGTLAGIGAWLVGEGLAYLAGAALLGSVVPLTLAVIRPVNERLMGSRLDPGSVETQALLTLWNRLHGLRTALGMLAYVAYLAG
jgi:hypothetical protein